MIVTTTKRYLSNIQWFINKNFNYIFYSIYIKYSFISLHKINLLWNIKKD